VPSDLDDDELLLGGPPVRPVLSEAEGDVEGRRSAGLSSVEQDQPCGRRPGCQGEGASPLAPRGPVPCRKSLRLNTLIFISRSRGLGGPCSGTPGPDQNTLH